VNFWAIGLDFKSAPLEARVQAGLRDKKRLQELISPFDESLCLFTCNRVELYGYGKIVQEDFVAQWVQLAQMNGESAQYFQVHQGRDALKHLFRVTSSLESMVVVESQIGGQVKRAYQDAVDLERAGPVLHRFFQFAFRVAKKIRSETEVGQFAVSIPSVGVKMAEKVIGKLSHKVVGVIGLGEIGRVAAEHFGSVGPKKLLLYNRTLSVSEEFKSKMDREKVSCEIFNDFESVLTRSDVIISAINVPLIKKQHLKDLADKSLSPRFILDLGVPPSVEKFDSDQIYLYFVDDLKRIAEENSLLREQELKKAEDLVFEEVEKCWKTLDAGSANQTFERLSQKVKALRLSELKQLRQRLAQVSEQDWKEIEKMSERLSSKILQDPIVELKSRLEREEERETWLQFFKNIFRV